MEKDVDVIIIGSGYGGSIPAARLSEAGFKVLVLERGKRFKENQYKQSSNPSYLKEILDLVITSPNITFRTGNSLGGASINMDGAHYRIPKKSFQVKDKNGRYHWPESINYNELLPYYKKAEEMLKVRQIKWNEVPKAGGLFAKMCDSVGASCDRARMNYKSDCVQCGFCSQGCKFGKKMSLLHNYIPLAEKNGSEFLAEAKVNLITKLKTGYEVFYNHGGKSISVKAPKVIVACGGIHTPGLLLKSQKYLNQMSDQVGKNFNTNGKHSFLGILPNKFDNLDDYKCYMGMENAGVMSFHWFEKYGFTFHPGGGMEPTIFASNLAHAKHPKIPKRNWGIEFKRFVETIYPHRLIAFTTMGLVDSYQNIILNKKNNVDLEIGDKTNFNKYLDKVDLVAKDIEKKTGVVIIPITSRKYSGTTGAHLLSSCRISDSIKTGAANPFGELYGNEGLYVCDASAIPYSLGVNPALNISALAERTSEHIIKRG